MNQQEQDKIEQMLKSDNIDDVNLAGILIKEKLGLTDENLKLLYKFVELVFEKNAEKYLQYITRFELFRQLMQGDIHRPEIEYPNFTGFNQPYTNPLPYCTYTTGTDITGDCTLNSNGTTTLTNDTTTT